MDKKEINEKMNEFANKMKKFGSVVKDKAETVAIVGLETKDAVDKKLQDAKSDLAVAQQNYDIISTRAKSKFSSELIKAQMTFNEARKNVEAKKVEIQKDLADKKEAQDKDKLEKAIESSLEYADACSALAVVASKEAEISYLEALKNQMVYDEKFSDKK